MSHLQQLRSSFVVLQFCGWWKGFIQIGVSLCPRGTLNLCALTFKDIGCGCRCNDFHCLASARLSSSEELHTFHFLSWRCSQTRKKTSGGRRDQFLIDPHTQPHPLTQDGARMDQWPGLCCMAFSSRQISHKMLMKYVGALGAEEGEGDVGDFSLPEHFIDNIKGFVIHSTRN